MCRDRLTSDILRLKKLGREIDAQAYNTGETERNPARLAMLTVVEDSGELMGGWSIQQS